MELLEQCRRWHEKGEYQKIIDALEAIPAGERTPEMDSELARAYNNLAAPGDKELLRRAIALLEPHGEYFKGDHYWNFRMGYAYYYLDQEGPALRYFQQALEALPGDEDTQFFVNDCRKRLALPWFRESFRERTEKAWDAFLQVEGEIRAIMDQDQERQRGEEIIAKCSEALGLALSDAAFELGCHEGKYELILTPEGSRTRLFQLVYFRRHAPTALLDRWNILVGRQPTRMVGLRYEGWELTVDDVQVWAEKRGERAVGLTLYSEKLLPLLGEDEGRAWWFLSTLTDQVLGEVPAMALIDTFDVAVEPHAGEPIPLADLPQALREMGLDLSTDPEAYLETYNGYRMEPDQDPDADWRMDVIAGSTRCVPLINGYLRGEDQDMDRLHADGIVAGFFCYPLDSFPDEGRGEAVLDFRDSLEAAILEKVGEDAVTFIGGASGVYCGYLDFIAWDLPAVLDGARELLADSPLAWASFHTFRRAVGTVRVLSREEN